MFFGSRIFVQYWHRTGTHAVIGFDLYVCVCVNVCRPSDSLNEYELASDVLKCTHSGQSRTHTNAAARCEVQTSLHNAMSRTREAIAVDTRNWDDIIHTTSDKVRMRALGRKVLH